VQKEHVSQGEYGIAEPDILSFDLKVHAPAMSDEMRGNQ
jgi:hypothetical protein